MKTRTAPRQITHIDTSNSLHTRRPLCGEYRQRAYGIVDGMAYWKPGWAIPPHVDCVNCRRLVDQTKGKTDGLLQSSWL